MKTKTRGERLIREMLSDPARFNGNELLKEYFAGFPLETLRPLLASADRMVRRVAVWIASELGKEARPLIHEAVSLVHDPERYIRAYALDIIAVCSLAEDADKYVHVVRSLEDGDEVIRVQAMFLMSNAYASQLQTAAQSFGVAGPSDKLHKKWLSQLAAERLNAGAISSMIDSPEPLLRRYGAIAAWRCHDRLPELVSHLALSTDSDIRKFWERRASR
jgi:hypothetical protein